MQLINELWPHVQRTRLAHEPHLGSLSTTFLITMSIPILTIPTERIARAADENSPGIADDRDLDVRLTKAFDDVLKLSKLSQAPFFATNAWRFLFVPAETKINVAKGLSDEITAALSAQAASDAASSLPTAKFVSILRNSLAHAGIAYLDKTGKSSYGQSVGMYAFVSAKWKSKDVLEGYNILRVSEADYRKFLEAWVNWLSTSQAKTLVA